MIGRIGARSALAASAGVACLLFASPSLAALSCDVASIQSAAPADTTIVSAIATAAPVPHCKVDGYVTTTNPGPNRVNFRLQLPDKDFAGRYYFIGLGGSAGYVPTDSQIPAGNPLVQGFAVAGTDTGRQGDMLDWDFMADPVKALDHVHRGAHVTAQATQQITRAYYGTPKIFRYQAGCSGGGRMGYESVYRYPQDFDGVLMGAPGGTTGGAMLKFVHAAQQMMREPGAWLSPAKLKMVEDKVTAACDMTDGAKDGVVWDHRACKFDVATLRCPTVDGANCLTDPEIRSIKAILDGARGPKGELLSQPMPITNISLWSQFLGPTPPPWPVKPERGDRNVPAGYSIASSVGRSYFGQDFDLTKFNLKSQKDLDAWQAGAERTLWGLAKDPDLSGYAKAGGKTVFWNGVSDPCCGNVEFEDYYNAIGGKVGTEARDRMAVLYQVPGMGHCGSGTGPLDAPDQLLAAMIGWVEKGERPERVVVHRGANVKLAFADPKTGQLAGVILPPPEGGSRDFLLCPYPQVSVFDASKANTPGAVNDAANWSCQGPKPSGGRKG